MSLELSYPNTNPMRLTDSHVRLVHRDIPDPGPDLRFEHFSDADYANHLSDFLKHRPPGPIAVFGYGSLIWKPSFEPVSVCRAKALDWHRSFCLHMERWRGSADQPGLMMQIDRGGQCEGVIQEIAAAGEAQALLELWRREMTIKPPGNNPRWIDVEVMGGRRRAIAFTANPQSLNYAGGLPAEIVAHRLSLACGHLGSNAEYLLQTITALESEGIHDPHLWDLQDRVARIIEQRFPDAHLA